MNKWKIHLALIFALFVLIIPSILANGTHNGGHEEDTSIGHQLEEILPFHHFAEGHIFAGIMLVIFWVSFFYMLYSIFKCSIRKEENRQFSIGE